VDADALLRAVVSASLPGASLALPGDPVDREVWVRLLDAAGAQRLLGHVAAAVATGVLPVGDEQLGELRTAHLASLATVVLIERSMLDATRALEDRGVDHRVVKGAALAHTLYDDPSERGYGDVDLLVPGAHMEAALTALRSLGYRRAYPELRAGFDARFTKAVTLVGPSGYELDVHRTLLMGPLGMLVDVDGLLAAEARFALAGQPVRTLDPAGHALYAAYAVAFGDRSPKLSSQRDLAQLLLSGTVDEGRLLRLAERSRAQAVLARGIRSAWDGLALEAAHPLRAWADAYTPSAAELRLQRSYLGARRSYAAKARDALGVLPSTRERIAFLRAVLTPSRAFLDNRGTSALGWLRRGARATLGRADG
jgi:hypothetical protein